MPLAFPTIVIPVEAGTFSIGEVSASAGMTKRDDCWPTGLALAKGLGPMALTSSSRQSGFD